MINLDKKLHHYLTILLYFAFASGYLLIIIINESNNFIPLSILTLIVGLSTFSHIKYYRYDAVNNKAKLIIVINMILMFVFMYFNYTDFRQLFLLILIADCIFAFPRIFSIKYVIGTYVVYYPYIYTVYKYRMNWDYTSAFIDDIVISVFCIAILFLVKSQIIANVKYNTLLTERDEAFVQLEKYANKIEDLAIIEERNRIALVLHNSIGHSLTSIMLSLQAEKMELVSNKQISIKSFKVVETLIQDSMALLRKTIENADDFTQSMPFDEIVDCFIREASNNTKINITYDSKNIFYILNEQKSVILNVITEAVTNAVKHSDCSHIKVNIFCESNGISISIIDDGHGFETIKYGFGITKTIQQVNRLQGEYEIISNEGCHIRVFLPTEEVSTYV